MMSSIFSAYYSASDDMVCRLHRDRSGSIGIVFALALVPLVTAAGAGVDYSRAVKERTALQAALDQAVLAGAQDGSDVWSDTARKAFGSYVKQGSVSHAGPAFSKEADAFVGSVTGTVPTTLMNVVGIREIEVTVRARAATKMKAENSCLLSLETGQGSGITFNGAPNVSLAGCSMRSNSSLTCNGHSTGAVASIAAGSAKGCNNPKSGAPVVPDAWADLAANITAVCSSWPGATWSPNSAPTSPKMITVQKGTYTEYHVCGDLTVAGTGTLAGLSGSPDSVIVIENGSLIVADDAAISIHRNALVLTGNNSKPSKLKFPNGNGKAATLDLSPPRATPWKGVSIYQDPKLTDVDSDFGPGATLTFDGLIYLPKAEVTMRGNAGGGSPTCSKLVVKTFTGNGSVNLRQSEQGCAAIGTPQAKTADGIVLTQ